ncbi:hypothetical protein [Actinoplanes sp. NPDC089786]|uniref:hypothetical protein n=1 Tax=Actinoplanes sp. NPDC089786 TaxID=3155185 RepID=UPI0034171D83
MRRPWDPVPWREYPVEARPVLGVRYCTVASVVQYLSDRYEFGYLLWSDEAFTPEVVAREMTGLGFTVTGVSMSRVADQPWDVTITGGPPHRPRQSYIGRFWGGDCASVTWIGLWGRHAGWVVFNKPGEGVVNTYLPPSPAYLRLHHASCPTISRLQPGATTFTGGQYSKICGERAELEDEGPAARRNSTALHPLPLTAGGEQSIRGRTVHPLRTLAATLVIAIQLINKRSACCLTRGGRWWPLVDHGNSPWSMIFLSREEHQYQGLSVE